MTLAEEFEHMYDHIAREYAIKRFGHAGHTRAWQMKTTHGGAVGATKALIKKRSSGGSWLAENGSHHLCIEWQVLNPHFAPLFTDADRMMAWQNLNLWAMAQTGEPDQWSMSRRDWAEVEA